MPTLFARVNYCELFANNSTPPDLSNYDECHASITAHLKGWLATQPKNIACFDSEEKLLASINAHSHYSRAYILSFNAQEYELEPLAQEGQFKFFVPLFEEVIFLRALELDEYQNTIRFTRNNPRDYYCPEGCIYTPRHMVLLKKQIAIEAAKAVKTFIEKKASTGFFNCNERIITGLGSAIMSRSAETEIRDLVKQSGYSQLFEDKFKEISDSEKMKSTNRNAKSAANRL